jgi:23S rRNA (cytosine1962-C5)-methyltransferase
MDRPHSPRGAAEPGPRVPDRSLTPEEPLPAVAIRTSGSLTFVYRKMVEGPVRRCVAKHGNLGRWACRHSQLLAFHR